MSEFKDEFGRASVRKSVLNFIIDDLTTLGVLEDRVRYDVSNVPAWYLFGASTEEFVERCYRMMLDRAPSNEEVAGAAKGIATGVQTRIEFLTAVIASPEFQETGKNSSHLDKLMHAETQRQSTARNGKAKKRWRNLMGLRNWLKAPQIGTSSAEIAEELQSIRECLNSAMRPASLQGTAGHSATRPPTERSSSNYDLELLKERILIEIDQRHRGKEESLRSQLEFYLPYITPGRALGQVVDIGCGRGTFLEIMREHDISAIGLELSERQALECQRKNLNVKLMDALEYLRGSEDGQFAAITLFHVVEHLDFDTLVAILKESQRVLAQGGIVLIETPNPENIYVSTFMFHVDPTHVRPIAYQYISTVLEVIGFSCERLPVTTLLHDDVGGETGNRHLDHLLSVSANLSVLARKV